MYACLMLNQNQQKGGRMMTDTEALEEMMIRSNASISFISEKIGITNKAFSMKMHNISEFLASEIVSVKQILNLSNLERDRIFFM